MDRDSVDQRFMPDPYEAFVQEQPDEAARVRRLIDEGRRHLEQGASDQARASFIKALAIYPLIPAALTNLAALALHQEQTEQAWKYLDRLFEHFPNDPSGHGVAIRYWLSRGSRPLAYRHGVRALRGLRDLLEREEQLSDPSVIDRARIILLTTLAGFDADQLITELYELCPDRMWDANAFATLGIAFYNLGEFERASEMWARCGENGPADLYQLLLNLIEQEIVPPFRLDYQLGARLPSLDEVRQAVETFPRSPGGLRVLKPGSNEPSTAPSDQQAFIQAMQFAVVRRVPTVAVPEALHHVLHGTDEEAELALSILFFDHWPHLREVLPVVVRMERLAKRIRLNAALYMLWTDGVAATQNALASLESEPMTDVEAMLAHIIKLQIALVLEDAPMGRKAEEQARGYAHTVGQSVPAWMAVLEELAARLRGLESQSDQGELRLVDDGPKVAGTQGALSNVIPFPTGRGKQSDEGGK